MKRDLIKAELLIQLAKTIIDIKGSNPSSIALEYSQLAYKSSEAAYKILVTPDEAQK